MSRRSRPSSPRSLPKGGGELDVSGLPSYTFGPRSTLYWGTAGVIAIESTVFALAVASYFYLRNQAMEWPLGVPPPDLSWGTLNLVVMLLSGIPNHWTSRRAHEHDLGKVRVGLVVCIAFALVFLGVRIFEFRSLNVSWDANAYGSLVWLLLGLHTAHLLTDFVDTVVLAVLLFTGPLEGKRFADVADNAGYWDFVVAIWVPIYAVIYWAPRL